MPHTSSNTSHHLSAAITPVSIKTSSADYTSTTASLKHRHPTEPVSLEQTSVKSTKSFHQTKQANEARLVRWQFDLPLLILSSLLVLDFLGVEEARLFTRLQYRQPAHHGIEPPSPNTHPLDAFSPVTTLTGVYYRGGYKDIFFVLYMSLGLTLFRASVMRYILEPLGRRLHIRNVNKLERFKEQGYIFLYYSISWAMGMYLMYHSPHWFDTKHFWINYPHRDMTWHFKLYYLTSLAYAVHLVYVLQVEARRKDYAAMFAHHIVTIMLLACSYITCFTRIGNAILCMMDFADILLALAKCLRYAKFQRACDVVFGIFMLGWVYTRFYLYAIVCYSTYAEAVLYIEPVWDPPRQLFLTYNTPYFFLVPLGILQLLIIYWFVLICRVAVRVITGTGAHDNRSSSDEASE